MTQSVLDLLPLANSANEALNRFTRIAPLTKGLVSGSQLLYERAAILGLKPKHGFSPGGSCHLVQCRDGVLAINLPRSSDWELIPAWLGPWVDHLNVAANQWPLLATICRDLEVGPLLRQAHCLGLAAARADLLPPPPMEPLAKIELGADWQPQQTGRFTQPLVVDLSSLWAGPLCGSLLQAAGCRVIKVEGSNRYDGAREGNPLFYQLMNQGKESVVLDFGSEFGIHRLHQLMDRADIVIEASRPRALHHLGIHAERWVQAKRGRVWLSITGYGRTEPQGSRIGFGDDAGAAAGLCRIMYEATGRYQFVGDAIADPLTGIHGALYAWQSYRTGASELIALSLQEITARCLHNEMSLNRHEVLESCRRWIRHSRDLGALFPAGARQARLPTAMPGQHTESVFQEPGTVGNSLV